MSGEAGPLRVVAAIMMDERGRLLIAKRREGGPRGGLFELPGGKVEPGEGDREALTRELLEELGVVVLVGDCFGSVRHAYPDLTIELVAYRCVITSGEPSPIGAEEVLWVGLDSLDSYAFPAADAPLLERLRERGARR